MHFPRKSAFVVMVSVALLALSGRALAITYVVGTCKTVTHQFTTIGAAVAAAPPGINIEVCPGTYPKQVLIGEDLTLVGISDGTGAGPVIVPPAGGLVQNGVDIFGNPVAAQIFVANASVKVNDLTVDGTGNNLTGCGGPTLEGIYFQNASGQIKNDAVRNQYQTDFADYGGCQNGLAINVESLTSTNSVTIANNSVRNYQKNGITATGAATGPGSSGPVVTVFQNAIVGMAATAMNWPGGAAENGIQVGFGASGTVQENIVNDNIWYGDTSSDPGDAASGILVYASTGINILSNRVGSAQFGITVHTDPTYGPADGTTITGNKVSGTQLFDGIDLCSSSNVVESNNVYSSAESGVHVDDSCGSGNNNTVTGNEINEACAGILLGTGTGTTSSPNQYWNVTTMLLAGEVCPAVTPNTVRAATVRRPSLHASPYKPVKLAKK